MQKLTILWIQEIEHVDYIKYWETWVENRYIQISNTKLDSEWANVCYLKGHTTDMCLISMVNTARFTLTMKAHT